MRLKGVSKVMKGQ